MKKYIAITMTIVVLFSCTTKKDQTVGSTISQSDFESVELIPVQGDTLFDYQFIKLQSEGDGLIGTIDEIVFTDDAIFICDINGSALKKFDRSGAFLQNIGSKGQGPADYLTISRGFYIDEKHNTINIFDPLSKAVLRYDLNGKYINRVKHNNRNFSLLRRLSLLENGDVFCHADNSWLDNYEYFVLDGNNYTVKQIIKNYFLKTPVYVAYNYAIHPYTYYNRKIHFASLFSNVIKQYDNGALSDYLIISDGKENIDSITYVNRYKDTPYDLFKFVKDIMNEGKYTTGIRNYFETDQYIFCDYYSKGKYGLSMPALLYNKHNGRKYRILDSSSAPELCSNVSYCYQNTLVRVWKNSELSSFKRQLDEGDIQRTAYPQEVLDIVDNFNEEDDNPILILYTPKKTK